MKKILTPLTLLPFMFPSHSSPMNEGVEYKCTPVAMHRIAGDKVDEMKLPANTKPFYITLRNKVLYANYKLINAPEVTDNNSKLIKTSIEIDNGRKFDASAFVKTRNDGENTVNIFRELNVKDQTLTMVSISKYTDMPAILRTISNCGGAK
jgi:hypothetical protein